jgi:hypothetical protein
LEEILDKSVFISVVLTQIFFWGENSPILPPHKIKKTSLFQLASKNLVLKQTKDNMSKQLFISMGKPELLSTTTLHINCQSFCL